jgi:hypothetical protein
VRPPNKVRCPGPHDKTTWRNLGDLLCRDCWLQLTTETRRRLKLSGGSGRVQPVVRFDQLRNQVADGIPLHEIEVSE